MAFGLTIGTPRATALQNSIQDELMRRGYSQDADQVMAEYITIMIINNKTSEQINSELLDLIGPDLESDFVEWLFAEAAKGAPESVAPPTAESPTSVQTPTGESAPFVVGANEGGRRAVGKPRPSAPLYQQALNQAFPASAGQKRPMSARSPSPVHLNKARRMDLPTGPRAMFRDGQGAVHGGGGGSRSLLERVGPPRNGPNSRAQDDVQMRIDNITASSPDANMMMMGGFPMAGMDMGQMNVTTPVMLQEMMMGQMALMTQMASAMGMMGQGQYAGGGGFPMQQQGMGNDMGFGEMQGHHMNEGMAGRGRGRGRGGMRGTGRGRGGAPGLQAVSQPTDVPMDGVQPAPAQIISPALSMPIPTPAAAFPATATGTPAIYNLAAQVHPAFVPPERPQSPTLCKYGVKCTNPLCRYSHPSPVATVDSGVVTSKEACQEGKYCKDPHCTKMHVSPAVLKSSAEQLRPSKFTFVAPPVTHGQSQMPCRYGASCTRPDCIFQHPGRPPHHVPPSSTPCRYGAACTRESCPYQHPKGRAALPSTFHRGLTPTGPMVNVSTSGTRSFGTQGFNKSVTFNKPDSAAIEKRLKKMEEEKSQAEKAIAQAEAAAAEKKDEAMAVGA
ncbi:uncharacterized protein LAESUDRAFT_745379 [Laetiporus sulphureus 93-53]|uniref:C3H1-type domain-containing protein n=1 Tax=Laetiporus sulphureus 93-53 TaxID=1314785 RepID=A0A165BQ41_9APHY|nr:uncharacterized protein LAESUDRAFT_745379 [Laetiporus sulphureus 93-53]KZT01450.1 hypothetical protein LAESUDRAFT_745379 [Laetiporus sulphureus 93-53]